MRLAHLAGLVLLVPFVACAGGTTEAPTTTAPTASAAASAPTATARVAPLGSEHAEAFTHNAPAGCGNNSKLKVHFYSVSQALSALVDLPNGMHVLVDTGDMANRPGCGAPCKTAHEHLMTSLNTDLGGAPIDLLWITHQHSDHIGGAIDVVNKLNVKHYVDNGLSLNVSEISNTHGALQARGVAVDTVSPGHTSVPLSNTGDVKLTAIVPSSFLPICTAATKDDRNQCSIMLRVDYCNSSILFTGDEETEEEALFSQIGHADLLQVGHHGSKTSSGASFVSALTPKYAVISAGRPDEGENAGYCHPSRSTVEHLTTALGGAGTRKLSAFDGQTCKHGVSHLSQFVDVPASDKLWATERDGDVVLSTTGDGTFVKE